MSKVVMIVGCPASGKGTLSEDYIKKGYVHLNRDKEGGKVSDLLPKMEQLLKQGQNIILDNTFPTIESRAPFIEIAQKNNAEILCEVMKTTIEEAQLNALFRMHDRYGKIFFTAGDIKDSGVNDPNMFPPAALFRYRKEYQKPKKDEGFVDVNQVPFTRRSRGYSNKAIILDYDGTLRDVKEGSPYKYPTKIEEIDILPGRKDVLNGHLKDGYLLLGVSNQSGIGKKKLTEQAAIDCFEYTNKQLGIDIEYYYCPHIIPPAVCYCRKPQSGFGVMLIEKHKLDPSQCIMVGDSTSDKTFAKRVGFQYEDRKAFFKENYN